MSDSDDIVERLLNDDFPAEYVKEAAAEITRLRGELAEKEGACDVLAERCMRVESELAAEREASKLLAARVGSCETMLVCYRIGRRPHDKLLDTARATSEAVDLNQIAAAAIQAAKEKK